MLLVELHGEYSGSLYDLIELEIENDGAYGVAQMTIKTFGDDKIFGNEETGVKITGGLQHIAGGIYARFQGALAKDGDKWHIEVHGSRLQATNSNIKSIQVARTGKSINKRWQ